MIGRRFTVEPLPPGPYVGCTWGGSRTYGPPWAELNRPKNLCHKEARWIKTEVGTEFTWFLCPVHVEAKLTLRTSA